MTVCTLCTHFGTASPAALSPTRPGAFTRERTPGRRDPRPGCTGAGRRLCRRLGRPPLPAQRQRHPASSGGTAAPTGPPVAPTGSRRLGLGRPRLVGSEVPRPCPQGRPDPVDQPPQPRLRVDHLAAGRWSPRRPDRPVRGAPPRRPQGLQHPPACARRMRAAATRCCRPWRPSPTRAWAARWCMSSTAKPTRLASYRDWQAAGRHFLVRAKDGRKVRWQGQEQSLAEVAGQLPLRRCREVRYRGQRAVQHVAETEVVLDRPAWRHRRRGGPLINQRVPGPPLTLRLVVSRVCDASGRTLAVWYLLTNLPATVATDTAALWYYWRWRIESLFKLFKSAGHQVEHWQQQGGRPSPSDC